MKLATNRPPLEITQELIGRGQYIPPEVYAYGYVTTSLKAVLAFSLAILLYVLFYWLKNRSLSKGITIMLFIGIVLVIATGFLLSTGYLYNFGVGQGWFSQI